jgi:hypothetical protein
MLLLHGCRGVGGDKTHEHSARLVDDIRCQRCNPAVQAGLSNAAWQSESTSCISGESRETTSVLRDWAASCLIPTSVLREVA